MHSPMIFMDAIAVGALAGRKMYAQSALEVAGASPLLAIENEAPARLIVDPPLPDRWPRDVSSSSIEPRTYE
jgi:hypothetical protein